MEQKRLYTFSGYVDVCGVAYKIKEILPCSRNDTFMGRCDTALAEIMINIQMPAEQKKATEIHEWLHAVLDASGLPNEEAVVSVLANELYRQGFTLKKRKEKK